MAYFDGIRVGDKLWTMQEGEVTVSSIEYSFSYPIRAGNYTYTMDGFINKGDYMPSAFWANPEVVLPPRPKRKVKKQVVGHVNVYPGDDHCFHHRELTARCGATSTATAVAVKVTGEYEVEE